MTFEPGAVLRIELDDGRHSYARMLARPSRIAFFDCRVDLDDPFDIVHQPVLFVLEVYDRAYTSGRWPKIGQVSLETVPLPVPDRFMQALGTGVCQIVDEFFNLRPATPEECVGLERVAVWEPEGVERRLMDHYAGTPNADVEYMKVVPGA